jgi:protein TonB
MDPSTPQPAQPRGSTAATVAFLLLGVILVVALFGAAAWTFMRTRDEPQPESPPLATRSSVPATTTSVAPIPAPAPSVRTPTTSVAPTPTPSVRTPTTTSVSPTPAPSVRTPPAPVSVRPRTPSSPVTPVERPERPVRYTNALPKPRKTHDVAPVYPSAARAARIQGVVVIEATIDAAGRVQSVKVIRSVPMLDQAAIDAVRQWQYAPTLINGVPTPVILTVTVSFTLK